MKTSLSNLIKKEEYFRFDIESFEEEDLGVNQEMFLEEDSDGRLFLPLGDGLGEMPKIPPAGTERDRLSRMEREAYQKGFAQGQKDGLNRVEKKTQETRKQMLTLFEELGNLKKKIFSESEEETVQLSFTFANKIVKKEVSLDPDRIRSTVNSVLELLADKSFVRILINRLDMRELEQFIMELLRNKKLQHFELVEDHCVGPGVCILESGFNRSHATLEGRPDELETGIEDIFRPQEMDRK